MDSGYSSYLIFAVLERKNKNLRSAGLLYIRISIVSGLIREIP